MKTKVRIQTYHASATNVIMVMHFMEPEVRYFLRVQDDLPRTEWELRYYNENSWSIGEIDDTIGVLLNASEEELFQHSCVDSFDVYMVHAGMQELNRRLHGNYSSNTITITLAY